MKKIKILVNVQDKSGVSYHRLFVPYSYLGNNNNDIDIVISTDINTLTDEKLKEFDAVVVNRHMDKITCKSEDLIKRIKKLGLKIIVDMDDLYYLGKNHILYDNYEPFKQDVIATVKAGDIITVTHQLMATTLSKDLNIDINKFYILPNSINDEIDQFQYAPNIIGDKIKFGWSGSVTHFEDVLTMYESIQYCYKNYELKDKFTITYAGYSNGDKIAEAIAGVLSGKGIANNKQFFTYGTKSVDEYANFYKDINVSLIPLEDNIFNRHKSNLKLLEAGFHKKAVICKNIHPYNNILTKENCIIINNNRDWWKGFDKLIKNPNLIIDLGEQLYKDIQYLSTKNVIKNYKEFLDTKI
jgi:hypothetical protein